MTNASKKSKKDTHLFDYHKFCMDYTDGSCKTVGVCDGVCAGWKTFNEEIKEDLNVSGSKPADFYALVREKTTIYDQSPSEVRPTLSTVQVQELLSNYDGK